MASIPLSESVVVGGLLAAAAIGMSVHHIIQVRHAPFAREAQPKCISDTSPQQHLKNYSRPEYQMHIVRILVMVPIYSLTSWLQLVVTQERTKLTLELLRDSYEAYVIYNFVVLLIKYAGGDFRLSRYLETQPRIAHSWPVNVWIPPRRPGPAFLNFIRASVLQFVFMKPSGAFLKLYVYESASHGVQLFVRVLMYIVNNVSIYLALYGLVQFYYAAHDLLEPFHPLPKFLSVKAVVFFSFWQGVAIQIAIRIGLLHDVEGVTVTEQATGLQDILICFEMAIAAIAHYYVFSYKEYQGRDKNEADGRSTVLRNFGDIVDFRDVLSDVKDRINGGVGFEAEMRDGAPVAAIENVLDEVMVLSPRPVYDIRKGVSHIYDAGKPMERSSLSHSGRMLQMFSESDPLLQK